MSLIRIFMHTYLRIPYGLHKITRTGAFGGGGATYITDPMPSDGNPLKAALAKYHVKQYHEASCSVATVVSVVNALLSQKDEAHEPISQLEILEKVRAGHWKERMSEKGHNGRRGLPLPLLGEIVESSLQSFSIPYAAVETVSASKSHRRAKNTKTEIRRRLLAFENQGNCVLIAHFDQGAYVRTLNIPHISPVGGFDPLTGEVTILDVDPDQPQSYKIPFDTFYKGMSSNYGYAFTPFGYKSGGYVCIRLTLKNKNRIGPAEDRAKRSGQ